MYFSVVTWQLTVASMVLWPPACHDLIEQMKDLQYILRTCVCCWLANVDISHPSTALSSFYASMNKWQRVCMFSGILEKILRDNFYVIIIIWKLNDSDIVRFMVIWQFYVKIIFKHLWSWGWMINTVYIYKIPFRHARIYAKLTVIYHVGLISK